MKLLGHFTAISLAIISLTGCVGTKHISQNIDDDGHIEHLDDVIFPDINKAWQKHGLFPNLENLSKVRSGLEKDEIYTLIGRPHFSERQRAREWDYIMKFRQNDNSVKICQYKIIFDKDYKAQEFYWLPTDCAPQSHMVTTTPVAVVAPLPIISESITLSADALFRFDKYQTQDMLPQGKAELDNLAIKLKDYSTQGDAKIIITGHTDHLGGDVYNLNLSQLRAQTVRSYLINQGVAGSSMVATGAGETQPVKQCSNQSRTALIDCLQPNRRVEVSVSVYKFNE